MNKIILGSLVFLFISCGSLEIAVHKVTPFDFKKNESVTFVFEYKDRVELKRILLAPKKNVNIEKIKRNVSVSVFETVISNDTAHSIYINLKNIALIEELKKTNFILTYDSFISKFSFDDYSSSKMTKLFYYKSNNVNVEMNREIYIPSYSNINVFFTFDKIKEDTRFFEILYINDKKVSPVVLNQMFSNQIVRKILKK